MTNNKRLDFGANPDHDPHSGILDGILPLRNRPKNLAGSAGLAKVCAIRVLMRLLNMHGHCQLSCRPKSQVFSQRPKSNSESRCLK